MDAFLWRDAVLAGILAVTFACAWLVSSPFGEGAGR